MKGIGLLSFLFFYAGFHYGQNSLRLFSAGPLFRVKLEGTYITANPQAEVLIEALTKDTLSLNLEFEDNSHTETQLYLLDQGKKTGGREFDYRLDFSEKPAKVIFIGSYDPVRVRQPLVPEKPREDTSLKYHNKILGHFCELEDDRPVYFNNLPKTGSCSLPMPGDYLNYAFLLINLSQTADARFEVAENTCRNNCITVDQLNALLPYVAYEVEKLKLVKIAYFSLTDTSRRKDLEKSFHFESSIRELNSFFRDVAAYKLQQGNCHQASDTVSIKLLYSELSAFKNDAQRLEALKKIYDQYCYTTAQIVQVLKEFIHDREKLDAAKMLYFYCVEKENYNLLSQVFSYKETAAELEDFISKQR